MFFKLFLFLTILINLGLPLVNKLDLVFIFIFISFLILFPSINWGIFIKKKITLFFFIIITSINLLIPKNFFHEFHQVFLNSNDIEIISNLLPSNVMIDIKKDYNKHFDIDRALKSREWQEKEFNKSQFINKPFAYSSDNFFQKSNFTRKNNKIEFKMREQLRIGEINSGKYNLPFDKQFRRELPYYVLYEIDKKASNSKICSNKKLYFFESNKKLDQKLIQKQTFSKTSNDNCLVVGGDYKYLYLLGYSINLADNLEINTEYNLEIIFLKSLKYFFTLIIILLIFNSTYQKNYYDFLIYFISVCSGLILTFIRDPNLIFGIRYFRGGADGLQHYSHGKDILENISNNNFISALQGGEDVFYFMPGLRYFSAINNLFFGDTTYGYLILCTLLPLLFFKLFKKITNKKISFYIFISFIFIPIFENMGFGYFNYIWQFARHHAETLSILLIVYSIYLIVCLDLEKKTKEPLYLIGIFLSLSVFLRPNFFPTSLVLVLCSVLILFQNRNYKSIFFILTGYSLIFISLIHNYYFGNSLFFFTDSGVNFKLNLKSLVISIISIIKLDFNNENFLILKSQISNWNPLYNIHRLIILTFIFYIILKNKHKLIIYSLFISMILQHGVLLVSHPSSRYAYLAWLLTFVLFVYSFFYSRKKMR